MQATVVIAKAPWVHHALFKAANTVPIESLKIYHFLYRLTKEDMACLLAPLLFVVTGARGAHNLNGPLRHIGEERLVDEV